MPAKAKYRWRGLEVWAEPKSRIRKLLSQPTKWLPVSLFPWYFEHYNPRFNIYARYIGESALDGSSRRPTELLIRVVLPPNEQNRFHSWFTIPNDIWGSSDVRILKKSRPYEDDSLEILTPESGHTKILLVDDPRPEQASSFWTLYTYRVFSEERLWLAIVAVLIIVLNALINLWSADIQADAILESAKMQIEAQPVIGPPVINNYLVLPTPIPLQPTPDTSGSPN